MSVLQSSVKCERLFISPILDIFEPIFKIGVCLYVLSWVYVCHTPYFRVLVEHLTAKKELATGSLLLEMRTSWAA